MAASKNSEEDYPTEPVEGWVGGFCLEKPQYKEGNPGFNKEVGRDLSGISELLDNLANIDKLQRQQKVRWPEFSWETKQGDKSSRCFQRFATNVSRVGYTNEGRIYSIICPQQGAYHPLFGGFNVEVTVTGQRGWVDESDKTACADISVEGKIWFTPKVLENFPAVARLEELVTDINGYGLPLKKENALVVSTHKAGDPTTKYFRAQEGECREFKSPNFARHEKKAWNVANLQVQIGSVQKTDSDVVNGINQLILEAFNVASGNMLEEGNILTWNVWLTAPELVDQNEWRDHAEEWRTSLNSNFGSPDGEGTKPKFFNGEIFDPFSELKITCCIVCSICSFLSCKWWSTDNANDNEKSEQSGTNQVYGFGSKAMKAAEAKFENFMRNVTQLP